MTLDLHRTVLLAVASGKGGTGKTTVALNLAAAWGSQVQLLDCDVEEPNCHLFLNQLQQKEEPAFSPLPQMDASLCDGCGICSRFCRYNAIACCGNVPLVFAELCHGCGGCTKVCPKQAIVEVPRRFGVVSTSETGKLKLVQGKLDIGRALAPPLIREVKKRRERDIPGIIDAPPGTSCSMITAVQEADFVILVTEPTPFGMHDLALAVEVVRVLALPFGVVINRSNIGDERVREYCRIHHIAVLAEIPDDRRIAEAYSRGHLATEALPEYGEVFCSIVQRVLSMVGQNVHSVAPHAANEVEDVF